MNEKDKNSDAMEDVGKSEVGSFVGAEDLREEPVMETTPSIDEKEYFYAQTGFQKDAFDNLNGKYETPDGKKNLKKAVEASSEVNQITENLFSENERHLTRNKALEGKYNALIRDFNTLQDRKDKSKPMATWKKVGIGAGLLLLLGGTGYGGIKYGRQNLRDSAVSNPGQTYTIATKVNSEGEREIKSIQPLDSEKFTKQGYSISIASETHALREGVLSNGKRFTFAEAFLKEQKDSAEISRQLKKVLKENKELRNKNAITLPGSNSNERVTVYTGAEGIESIKYHLDNCDIIKGKRKVDINTYVPAVLKNYNNAKKNGEELSLKSLTNTMNSAYPAMANQSKACATGLEPLLNTRNL